MWIREWSALDIVNDCRHWRYDVLVDDETVLFWETDRQDREQAREVLKKQIEERGLSEDNVIPFPDRKMHWEVIDV